MIWHHGRMALRVRVAAMIPVCRWVIGSRERLTSFAVQSLDSIDGLFLIYCPREALSRLLFPISRTVLSSRNTISTSKCL